VIALGTENAELRASRARVRELVERAGDPGMAVSFLSGSWAAAVVRGEYRTGLAIAEQMLALAEREAAARPRLVAHAGTAPATSTWASSRRRASTASAPSSSTPQEGSRTIRSTGACSRSTTSC
jgi:hypothetical protein